MLFKNERYFSDGITFQLDGKFMFFIIKVNENGEYLSDVFEYTGISISDCLEAFENAQIWDRKTLYMVEHEIKWIDWC